MATMAFGNRFYAFTIPAPLKGLAAPLRGPNAQRVLENGQITLTRARLLRKHFDFVYRGSGIDLVDLQGIVEGQYGDGPWLFNYPHALNGNMLPRTWSQPALAIGARGNQAMDFWSAAVPFGAPLSATLANPNLQPVAITGLAKAPVSGMALWSPSSAAPVLPMSQLTRPYISLLVPPNYAPRITVWGSQNTTSAPGLYYSLSTIAPTNTTIAAGTLLKPVLGGVSVAPGSSGVWRVLDLWIAAGTSTTPSDYTVFGAMDVRMAPVTAPAQPTTFSFGRGQFPCQFSEDNIGQAITKIGTTDAGTHYEIDGSMDEVSSPW